MIKKFPLPLIIGFVFLLISFVIPPPRHSGLLAEGEVIVHETDSPYHYILITELDKGINGIERRLRFDRHVQSGVMLRRDGDGEQIIEASTNYTNLMHLPLIFNRSPKNMLMIGGGGGTLPREYNKHYGTSVQIAEIDPKVVTLAEEYFGLRPNDTDMRVYTGDGRLYLRQSESKYDVILLDAFSGGGSIPFHLTTQEFFGEIIDHLEPDGVVAMNVISALSGSKGRLYRSIMRTMQEAGFKQLYVFPRFYFSRIANEPMNIIIVGTMSEQRLSPAQINQIARELTSSNYVRVRDFVKYAGFYRFEEMNRNLDDAVVLTDDYAPVELMAFE